MNKSQHDRDFFAANRPQQTHKIDIYAILTP